VTLTHLSEIIAVTIERESGLPCDSCGGRHVETMQELEGEPTACTCRCCYGVWGELVAAEHPDLVITCGGVRVITEAAFAEVLCRLEAEVASLESAD
jgi:hypothetical protein